MRSSMDAVGGSVTTAQATPGLDYPGDVFFRSKSADAARPTTHEDPAERAGKGRATPKRKTSEAANKRPLVPADRKAAGKSARVAARTQRDREYRAMQTGEERYLPAKDKGAVRRYVRDHVDARWNLGEFFLPVAFVFVAATWLFSKNQSASLVIIFALYLVVLMTLSDTFLMWRRLKKKLSREFGDNAHQRGLAMYAATRAFQLRRARLPKPQVKHGEYPA